MEASMGKQFCLVSNCRDHRIVAMPNVHDTYTAGKIKIFITLYIYQKSS